MTQEGSEGSSISEWKERAESENASAQVTFNVGGSKYRVSRSLLDQYPDTMLSRMISDTWQQEGKENDEFFIERNGARFAYVLDYMRDGCVFLPGGNPVCTKSSLLRELIYFGFENVDEDSIEVEFSHLDAANYIARLNEDFEQERYQLVKSRDKLNRDIACLTVAHAICTRRLQSEVGEIEFSIAELIRETNPGYVNNVHEYEKTGNKLDFQVIDAVKLSSLDGETIALDKALRKYGLRVADYTEIRAPSPSYYVEKIENEKHKGMVYNESKTIEFAIERRERLEGFIKVALTVISLM